MQPAFKKAGIAFWRGWHGLRLASNLHRLQVQDIVIQRILRHSNVSVTQACYIKTANQDSVRALESLDAVLCPRCALESAKPQTLELQ
jgi:integrase